MKASGISGLVDLYGKDIYSFCKKLTYNEFDAEELYQDTFLKALEIASRIDEEDNPKSFLLSISVSLWKNKQRKYARRMRIAPTDYLDSDDNYNEPATYKTPEGDFLKQELYDTVNKCILELDDKMRIPILLYYNSQMSLEEIAEILKCPVGTVKSRLFKARTKLKESLEVYGVDRV